MRNGPFVQAPARVEVRLGRKVKRLGICDNALMGRSGAVVLIGLSILWTLPISGQTATDVAAALSRGELRQAVQLADSILREHPADVQVWTLRGVALARGRQDLESLASFNHALDVSPNYMPALQGAAQLAYARHERSASQFLKRIVDLDGKNMTAHAMLAGLAAESGDCPVAINEFREARSVVQTNADALMQYGDCELAEHQVKNAIETFRQILSLRPDEPSAKYKLAVALGDTTEALDLLKTLPANSQVLNLLAEYYAKRKDPESAVAALRQAIRLAPKDEQNYIDLGRIYIEQREPQQALQVENQALGEVPPSARLYVIRGAAYIWLNDSKHAEQDFAKADELEPEKLYGSVGMSMLFRQDQQLPEAIRILRQKLSERPSDATLNYLLADTLIRTGAEPGQPAFKEAVSLLNKTLLVEPGFQKAHVLLGKLYLRESRLEDAAKQLREAIRIDPHDRSAIYQLMLLFRRNGNTAEAGALAAKLKDLVVADEKLIR